MLADWLLRIEQRENQEGFAWDLCQKEGNHPGRDHNALGQGLERWQQIQVSSMVRDVLNS